MTRIPKQLEFVVDSIVNVFGVFASTIAMTVLIVLAIQFSSVDMTIAVVLYAVMVVLSFALSAIYNLWPMTELKSHLRKLDHAAIHLKIAGTYTPIIMLIGSVFSYVVLGLVWAAAIIGLILKLTLKHWPDSWSVGVFLVQGWAAAFLVWPMFETLQSTEFYLIIAGGLVYSTGVIFHVREDWMFHKALWHTFVLTGSSLFFLSVTMIAL
ncbi:MAG: PAQR family membrane homeostasis protein TrhA [Alphaproteobacteria bacterium]